MNQTNLNTVDAAVREIDTQLTQDRKGLSRIEKAILNAGSTRENAGFALKALQLAFMWIGKAKSALGIPSPYKKSFDPESKVIEPRADEFPDDDENALELPDDEIESTKVLRHELHLMEKAIDNDTQVMNDHPSYQRAINNAYGHCCEATMWLGMVLNDIKNDGGGISAEEEEEQKKEKEKKEKKEAADKEKKEREKAEKEKKKANSNSGEN